MQPLCAFLWGRRMGEFRNFRGMSGKERGGKGEAPCQGLQELSPGRLCSWVLPGKSPWCLHSSSRVGKLRAPCAICAATAASHSCSGLREQPWHRLAPLWAVFSLQDRSAVLQQSFVLREKMEFLSLLFCLLLPVVGAEFKVMPGALVSLGRQRRCCRKTLCVAVRAPLFSAWCYQEKH